MKKLMTLLSAAAVAFGLQAADFADTGTSFEGMTAGDLDITSSINELVADSSGYWETNGNAQVSLTVVDGTSVSRSETGKFPEQFEEELQQQYLSIKTPFGNPAVRHINSNHNTKSFTNGFYFDSLVKFTAFDDDPTTTAVTNDFEGAKIAVWLQEVTENDVVTGTNLCIRAGYLGGQGDPTAKTYVSRSFRNADAWHRLTIKAIPSIYAGGDTPGFVVFIDGQYVKASLETYDTGIDGTNVSDTYAEYFENRALFPSMVQSVTGYDSLKSVSFDGQGEVDDIVFTETAPDFAKDSEYVHIYWTPADITALTIDGDELTPEEIAAGDYKASFSDNLQLAVTATYAEGKVGGAWTTTGSATVSGNTFSFTAGDETGTIVATAAAASFDGSSFASLSGAIAAAKSATVADKVLKIFGATTASDDIDLTGAGVRIKIDLNGWTIGGITSDAGVWVVDSGVGGTGTVSGEVFVGDGSQIDAGTFEAFVLLGEDSEITGGRFNKDNNDAESLPAAPGYEFVAEGNYLVLVPATPKFAFAVTAGDNSYVSNVSIDNVDVTTDVTNGTITVIASNVAWSVTFTANDGYEFDGGLTTTNFTGTAEAAVDLTGPDAAKQQGGGWVDPEKIPENTEAGDQYPELADSELAETDAKKLTEWAVANSVQIGTVAAAAPNDTIYDAYLLGCAPTAEAVAAAKEDFVPSITIVDGEVVVTEPQGTFNGRLNKKGSANLKDWYDANTNEGYNFFKYELVP